MSWVAATGPISGAGSAPQIRMAVSSDGGRLFSPGVDIKTGNPLQPLQILSEEAARLPPLTGTGSPEGIIESKQGRFYINIAGGVGTILYVKRLDDIAGNRKTGWTLV